MKEFTYKIKSENGIHARPAGMLVKFVSGFKCDVKISFGEKSADAKRLFALMGLGVKQNDEIKVCVNAQKADKDTSKETNTDKEHIIEHGINGDDNNEESMEEERAVNAIYGFLEQNF